MAKRETRMAKREICVVNHGMVRLWIIGSSDEKDEKDEKDKDAHIRALLESAKNVANEIHLQRTATKEAMVAEDMYNAAVKKKKKDAEKQEVADAIRGQLKALNASVFSPDNFWDSQSSNSGESSDPELDESSDSNSDESSDSDSDESS